MNDDLIWMDVETGTWGGSGKDGLIIVPRGMISDDDRLALEFDPTEDEVYAILMKYVDAGKSSRIVTD
jgi:hypothetical protein